MGCLPRRGGILLGFDMIYELNIRSKEVNSFQSPISSSSVKRDKRKKKKKKIVLYT
jgi:hypothetical protein